MRYHINPETGVPGLCSAEEGNCPFGGEHYPSEAEASVAYERQNMDKLLSRITKTVPGIKIPQAAELDQVNEEAAAIIARLPSVDDLRLAQTEPTETEKLIALGEEIKSELKAAESQPVATADANSPEGLADHIEVQLPPEGETLEDVMAEMDDLVGMHEIKKHVKTTSNLLRIAEARKKAGLKVVDVGIHSAFVGGPGTGKTTMARFMGRAYKAAGRLSKGHLVEVDREALVAGYSGQTAIKTKAVLEKAKGGVLFIDEAYSLVPEGSNEDFGKESISTILKFMEDNRGDFALIVAGYSKEMKTFLDSNSGLSSRFNDIVDFKDYGADDLDKIMTINLKKNEYEATPEVRSAMRTHIASLVENKSENFGNARTLRSYFEAVVERQADRLSSLPAEELTKERLLKVEISDLPEDLKKFNH